MNKPGIHPIVTCLLLGCIGSVVVAAPGSRERPYVDAAPRGGRVPLVEQDEPALPPVSEEGTFTSVTSLSLLPDAAQSSKNRFISFSNPAVGLTALRVTLLSLHHVSPPYTRGPSVPFTQFEGQELYVGAPTRYVESRAGGIPWYASRLQCEPYYHDWSTVGLLHVTGEAVVPSSTYEIEIISRNCLHNEIDCTDVSYPLFLETSRWGDVVNTGGSQSQSQTDFDDISALMNKFRDAPGAPNKPMGLLAGINDWGTLDPKPELNYTHISVAVDAFRGAPYPHRPGKCTNNSSAACLTDEDCADVGGEPGGNCILCGSVSGGACCRENGTCDIVPLSVCEETGGDYKGDAVPCSRCCGPDGPCKALTTAEWMEVQLLWPNVKRDDICREGPASPDFNCIAWTINNTTDWLWKDLDLDGDGLWELSDFEIFFAEHQKSAIIYGGNNNAVLHTARPLPNNCASSKAGEWIRIRHDRNQIESGYYGDIVGTHEY